MKKIVFTLLILSAAIAGNAQDIKSHRHKGMKNHHEMALQQLSLTADQKTQLKSLNDDYSKQVMDLKKTDNITVKEWKARKENLRTEHKARIQSLLTTEQKDKMQKMKANRKAMREVDNKARMEKMKIRLGLTNDQVSKIQQNHKEMAEKMKSLHENKSMDVEKRKEQMKALKQAQKEKMRSILTAEQQKQMKEGMDSRRSKRVI
jgi:Spy/CpxP family protein refolding chaperone